MSLIKIVTSFITNSDRKFLLLKRSTKVKTMKGLWSGISGIIENNESPLQRAKIEIYEELNIAENDLKLLKQGPKIIIQGTNNRSNAKNNHSWEVSPFLFTTSNNPQIKLNWENSEFRWVTRNELSKYSTVPYLDKVLCCLLL